MKALHASMLMTCCAVGAAQADPPSDKLDNINNYLSDISGGAVSAVSLIDAKGMTITPIETAQDVIVAITPLASGDGNKKAFGIAITPARTTLLPMSGAAYLQENAWWNRLWGNLTFSYAQNQAEHTGVSYRQSAFSVDTVYFFKLKDDPVSRANDAFVACAPQDKDFLKESAGVLERRKGPLARLGDASASAEDKRKAQEELNQITAELNSIGDRHAAFLNACMDASLANARKAPWNSARMSISYGEGRIRPEAGGNSYSLGKAFNLNAQHSLNTERGLLQLSLRHARDAVDPKTLSGTASTKSSSLAALRFTYGDQGEESPLRVLAEVSSARSSDAGVYQQAFMYAVGADKRLAKGSWLEFRLGRNRSVVDGKEQTTALLSLNLAPTLMEFKK